MRENTIREGTPSLAAALVVATFGFLIFGGITIGVFMPEELRAGHYVVGGITGLLALLMYPWQVLDVRTRRHVLTDAGLIYSCGVISRFEVEVPYRNIQGVSIQQGIIQRLFGCGNVRVSVQGVSGPVMMTQQDMNSVSIRSIPDFREVSRILRDKMNERGSHNQAVEAMS